MLVYSSNAHFFEAGGLLLGQLPEKQPIVLIMLTICGSSSSHILSVILGCGSSGQARLASPSTGPLPFLLKSHSRARQLSSM